MVYDPVNRRLVVYVDDLGGSDDAVVAFDTMTREWTVLLEPSTWQAAPSPE